MAADKITLIVPLVKSPRPRKGRIGPDDKQDWYACCELAARLSRSLPDSSIAVISSYQAHGEKPDAEVYEQTLVSLGVSCERLYLIQKGSETTGQIEQAEKLAKEKDAEILFVSTLLHSPRVWWLTRKKAVYRRIAPNGRPRPWEALTDIVLIFLFPVLDFIGMRQWFLDKTELRRASGLL
jgi:hypothetical protein